MVLAPMGKNRFKVIEPKIEATVEFRRENSKLPFTVYTMYEEGTYVYEPVQLVTPTREYLAQYAGDYYCEELDVVHRIEFRKEELVFKSVKKFKDSWGITLTPAIKDEFGSIWIRVQFLRDEEGEISGGVIDGVRVLNLKFKKIR